MENFTIKHYHNDNIKCISDFESCFYDQEIVNSIILSFFQNERPTAISCSVVLDKSTNELIFALFADKDARLYASGISKSVEKELYAPIVDLLVKDFLSTSFPFNSILAYDPVLPIFKESLEKHGDKKFETIFSFWAYDIEKVVWSPQSLAIKNKANVSLRKATMENLELLELWTQGFIDDTSTDLARNNTDIEKLCFNELSEGHVYFLFDEDVPVSMGWKRRPLRNVTALAYVYTPSEHRHKGYGKACVSMATEALLKEYQYITLFVNGKMDQKHNLYTAVGYRFMGKADSYAVIA